MIRFSLKCRCDTQFEGWFRSSDDYENQLQSGFVSCPNCGSHDVTKALMAPTVTGTKRNRDAVDYGAAQEAARQREADSRSRETGTTKPGEATKPGGATKPAEVDQAGRDRMGRDSPETAALGSSLGHEPPATGSAEAGRPAPGTALSAAHMPSQMADPRQLKQVVEALRELKKQVTAQATYVGNAFAEEARKMHFGEAELRAIYGEATLNDAKELLEEGIEIAPLPTLPEEHN